MMEKIIPSHGLKGTIAVPGDKSISHRAIMLGSIAEGITEITGFLYGEDCLSTVKTFRNLGIKIDMTFDKVIIEGQGLHGLKEPDNILDVGNSGTTIRLISGLLAGQKFNSFLTGDQSIRKRPMGRVIQPLTEMGAVIIGKHQHQLAPLGIVGSQLKPISYQSPVASAQVKSAVLLAGLYAHGWTEVIEPYPSRNHTELMMQAFGAQVTSEGCSAKVKGQPVLQGQTLRVPGDISSAAYVLVAGAIIPNSSIVVENVGLNPTRTGIIDVLIQMGANLTILEQWFSGGELMGNILIESSSLHGIAIGGEMIPRLIDEIPIIAVAAAFAQGVTEIRDASELKVKESNRLTTVAEGLRAFGCPVEILEDGLAIPGGYALAGSQCKSHEDHRIAMSMAIAAMAAQGETTIEQFEAVNVSWPNFLTDMRLLEVGPHD